MEGVELRQAHPAMTDGRVCWPSKLRRVRAVDCFAREDLGGLIVRLSGGQFISKLFATVELSDFGQVNFGKSVLHFWVLLIGDHAVSQLAFGGDMISTL